MAQRKKQINLLRNMLVTPPPVPHHEREVLAIRGLWLAMATGWCVGAFHLWPGAVSYGMLVGSAVAVVVSATLTVAAPKVSSSWEVH